MIEKDEVMKSLQIIMSVKAGRQDVVEVALFIARRRIFIQKFLKHRDIKIGKEKGEVFDVRALIKEGSRNECRVELGTGFKEKDGRASVCWK